MRLRTSRWRSWLADAVAVLPRELLAGGWELPVGWRVDQPAQVFVTGPFEPVKVSESGAPGTKPIQTLS